MVMFDRSTFVHDFRHALGVSIVICAVLLVASVAPWSNAASSSIMTQGDLVYGSEIGAWDMDGGTAINNATARAAVKAANISVIRWGVWKKFDYLSQGQSESMTLSQFNATIDGINSLGAEPFIKLPPVWNQQCDAAIDYWNLTWLKEIVKQAGNRVQLYEFANEPDNYCGWTGADYANYWNSTVPELKQYARSLGLTIYVGGPAKSTNYTFSLPFIQDFLNGVKAGYLAHGNDADYIPAFVSTHTYINDSEDPTLNDILARITYWGGVYDQMRLDINQIWQGITDANGAAVGPQIKIAASEYNYTINNADPRDVDATFIQSYMQAMMTMFKQHGVWLACQFTIASHAGGALDMLTAAGAPKPLYTSFKSIRDADLAAQQPASTPGVNQQATSQANTSPGAASSISNAGQATTGVPDLALANNDTTGSTGTVTADIGSSTADGESVGPGQGAAKVHKLNVKMVAATAAVSLAGLLSLGVLAYRTHTTGVHPMIDRLLRRAGRG